MDCSLDQGFKGDFIWNYFKYFDCDILRIFGSNLIGIFIDIMEDKGWYKVGANEETVLFQGSPHIDT